MFHRDYDKTLKIILEGDKDNRERIKNFLESIPKEIRMGIEDAISKWCQYEDAGVSLTNRNEFCFFGEYKTDDKSKYWFELDMLLNSLTIKKSIYLKNRYEDVMEICLRAPSTYHNVENNGRQDLGYFSYGCTKKELVNYNLIDTFLGIKFITSGKGNFRRSKYVDVDRILIDIENDSLNRESGCRLSRKIRCRRNS